MDVMQQLIDSHLAQEEQSEQELNEALDMYDTAFDMYRDGVLWDLSDIASDMDVSLETVEQVILPWMMRMSPEKAYENGWVIESTLINRWISSLD